MAALAAGHVLTNDEVADMLAFDEQGLRRPAKYDHVVFDSTSITGAVYRVRTTEEQKEADAMAAEGLAQSKASEERMAAARKVAGEEAVAAARAAQSGPNVTNVNTPPADTEVKRDK